MTNKQLEMSGDVLNVEVMKTESWTKYTYTIRDNNGKTSFLSMFISDKDSDEAKTKKLESIAKHPKGSKALFIYHEQGKYLTLDAISDIDGQPSKIIENKIITNNEKEKPLQLSEKQLLELKILRAECLNGAFNIMSNGEFNPLHEDFPAQCLKLAKRLFEQAKKDKFLEW